MNQHSTSEKLPKTARGRRTREKLLDAAEQEFGARGFHPVGISDITRRAGVAAGTFYVYFDSKEEIYRALIEATAYGTRMIVDTFKANGVPVDEIVASAIRTPSNVFALPSSRMLPSTEVISVPVESTSIPASPLPVTVIVAAPAPVPVEEISTPLVMKTPTELAAVPMTEMFPSTDVT